jgi:hypothetical protein
MTFFSIFSCFSWSAGQAPKKVTSYGNLQAGNFLKYLKKPKQSSYQERLEKKNIGYIFSFFFASLWKKANF